MLTSLGTGQTSPPRDTEPSRGASGVASRQPLRRVGLTENERILRLHVHECIRSARARAARSDQVVSRSRTLAIRVLRRLLCQTPPSRVKVSAPEDGRDVGQRQHPS